jgi:hypothetical protein
MLGLSRAVKFQILGAVLLALFLGVLDQTVVGTALPRIVTDLGGNGLYTWIVTAYLLTSTISIPFWGKLSDVYGRRPQIAHREGRVIDLGGSQPAGPGPLHQVAQGVADLVDAAPRRSRARRARSARPRRPPPRRCSPPRRAPRPHPLARRH